MPFGDSVTSTTVNINLYSFSYVSSAFRRFGHLKRQQVEQQVWQQVVSNAFRRFGNFNLPPASPTCPPTSCHQCLSAIRQLQPDQLNNTTGHAAVTSAFRRFGNFNFIINILLDMKAGITSAFRRFGNFNMSKEDKKVYRNRHQCLSAIRQLQHTKTHET